MVPNEKNELVLMRPVTGWRVCMDYCNLMHGPKKTIFLCPSWMRCWIDLPKRGFNEFLMNSGYNKISIAPEDQEKTTFTFPYGTFAFRIMPFGLCNAPTTF